MCECVTVTEPFKGLSRAERSLKDLWGCWEEIPCDWPVHSSVLQSERRRSAGTGWGRAGGGSVLWGSQIEEGANRPGHLCQTSLFQDVQGKTQLALWP